VIKQLQIFLSSFEFEVIVADCLYRFCMSLLYDSVIAQETESKRTDRNYIPNCKEYIDNKINRIKITVASSQLVVLWKVSLAPFCTIVKNDATHEMGSTDSEGLDFTASFEISSSSDCLARNSERGSYLKSFHKLAYCQVHHSWEHTICLWLGFGFGFGFGSD